VSHCPPGRIIELCLAYQMSVFDFAQTDIGRHTERSRSVTIKSVGVKSIAILKQSAVEIKMMID